MKGTASRRRFLVTAGAAVCSSGALCLPGLRAAGSATGAIRLGMMLQGTSTDDLLSQAGRIAAAGFDAVQLTFFWEPAADELRRLSEELRNRKLSVLAFGVYFNLFRPDDMGFMRSSRRTMQLVAEHSDWFDCRQFVTWSASYSPQFRGADPRNHSPEAVAELQRAIREVALPILEPIGGRVAFEPYYPHVFGSPELAAQVLAPFPAERVGLVMDPPNFISPELYPQREEEMLRAFRELGDRIHFVHFKDMKLNPNGQAVDLPGPGGGEMNYPLYLAELRKLGRPVTGIIEHIKAESEVMGKTKAWVEGRLRESSTDG